MKKTRAQFRKWKFSKPVSPSEGGFSLIEVLISIVIVAVGLLGLAASIVEMGKAKEKARIVAGALALQADFLEQLAKEDNFRDSAGNALDPDTVNITIQPTGTAITMGHNAVTYFKDDLSQCGGYSNDCVLSLTYDFLQDPPLPPLKPIWRAAYRIEISPTAGVNMGPLGTLNAGAFGAADFHFPLPDLLFKDTNVVGCSTATDIAIMGFDRDTGVVTCLKKPNAAATCPPGILAKAFVVDPSGQLVLDCQVGGGVAAKIFTCPVNYKLQTISDPRVFDPTYAGTNPVCVWEAQKTEFVGPGGGPAASLSGQVCPRPGTGPAYSQTQNCVLDTGGAQVPQTCFTIAGCATVFIFIPPTVPPTLTTTVGPPGDAIDCTATLGVTVHDPFVCFDASTDGTWAGTVTFPPRTCTLTKPETVAL